jgi:branched-subunit amino acid transport protein
MSGTEITLVLGMALVTLLPRILPPMVMGHTLISPRVEAVVKAVPFAALAVLIFPGVLTTDPHSVWPGAIGAGAAVFAVLRRWPAAYVVLFAVAVTTGYRLLTG